MLAESIWVGAFGLGAFEVDDDIDVYGDTDSKVRRKEYVGGRERALMMGSDRLPMTSRSLRRVRRICRRRRRLPPGWISRKRPASKDCVVRTVPLLRRLRTLSP